MKIHRFCGRLDLFSNISKQLILFLLTAFTCAVGFGQSIGSTLTSFSGDTATYDLTFGDSLNPVNPILSLDFEINVTETNGNDYEINVLIDSTNSWLAQDSDFEYSVTLQGDGISLINWAKSDQTPISGWGTIARVELIGGDIGIIDNLDAKQLQVNPPFEVQNFSVTFDTELSLDWGPNPAKDFISIHSSYPRPKQIMVIDGEGRTVAQIEVPANDSVHLKVDTLPEGLFFLKTDQGFLPHNPRLWIKR